MTAIKQVIVMRKDLNMRKGKMVAQGSHASMAFITRRFIDIADDYGTATHALALSAIEKRWLEESFVKICVSVDSEDELLAIQNAATEAGIVCHLITDNGLTEFDGVPTNTCLALGPDLSTRIDPLTSHLKLL